MKKALLFILSLVCVVSIIAPSAFAQENAETEKKETAISYTCNYGDVFTEFTCGWYKTDLNGNRYYEYDRTFFVTPEDVFTVYYSDGTKTEYTMVEEQYQDEYKVKVWGQFFVDKNGNRLPDSVKFSDDQLTNHWKVGTHYTNVEYHDLQCTFPVYILATGWKKENNKWYFYKDGDSLKYLQTINNKKYYFNGKGAMLTGWIKGKKWMYADLRSGVLFTGWHKINGKWYLFKYADSTMITGWAKTGGKWYYLNSDGSMRTGWVKYKNVWYYLDNTSGAMLTNTSVNYAGKTYRFNSSGACVNP